MMRKIGIGLWLLFLAACAGDVRKTSVTDRADSAEHTFRKDSEEHTLAVDKNLCKDSQQQLKQILDELSRRYEALDDTQLKSNLVSWGMGQRDIEVRFILNTPEARQAFRQKLVDSPVIRFTGPERPKANGRIGLTDTLGISLHPEYPVFSTTAPKASFLLLNHGGQEILCGERYSITFEDKDGTWRELPINDAAIDIAYGVMPGHHRRFEARLYPHVHPNKPGRYRFFYEVSLNTVRSNFTMMAEFRLTDDKQELARAVKMEVPEAPQGYGVRALSGRDAPEVDNHVYQVVEKMPEFPGENPAMMEYLRTCLRYPETALRDSVQGRVIVQFVVLEDGTIDQVQLRRSVDPRLDEEAIRLVRAMPRWTPGMQQGRVVKVMYVVPVAFRLPTRSVPGP